MRTRVYPSILQLPPANWNALVPDDNPFVRHEFIAALEASGCAGAESGWYPCHLACEDDAGQLLGVMPLYLKTNPYGEFVFDFAWANAYARAGLEYYPKLVSAVPFTPATGPRLLIAADADRAAVGRYMAAAAQALAKANQASSLHVLFPDQKDRELLEQSGLMLRKDCQFHWHNKNYTDFRDFLGSFTASKRKKALRERRRISEAGISFIASKGNELDEADWDTIMPIYANTFLRRGRTPYLNRDFFLHVCNSMPDNVVVLRGFDRSELVAVAICFRSASTLYGRYWGASRFIDSLHFETCYYQGIDYCIQEGIAVFEPGTQGEHKLSRGFVPVATWSAHWLSQPQFAAAVDDYLQRERTHVDDYIDTLGNHVPYKQADN